MAGKPVKKDSSPALSVANETVASFSNDAVDATLAVPIEIAAITAAPKESPKNTGNKEKSNKKKRNDAILIQQSGK